jgi:hypothetical protein
MRDGQDAGGNGRRRAARRTAGRMLEIPGIAGRAVQARLRCRHQAELGTGALAEDRDAGIEKALHQRSAVVGYKILQDGGAGGRARALEGIEVLQEKGNAGEGAVGQTTRNLPLGVVVMFDDDGVDLRIDFGGAGDSLVEQFLARDLFVSNQFGKADRVVVAVFLEGHARTSLAGRPGEPAAPRFLALKRSSRARPD